MNIIDSYLLPGSLWFIMFSIGLSLTAGDFVRVIRARRALIVGVVSMLLIPPAVGVVLAVLFAPTPALIVGFILLATCPGGMLSNLMTDFAKGDLALSLSLSVIVSLIYVIVVPFYAYVALNEFMGIQQSVRIPLGEFVWNIFSITLVPAGLGVALRAWKDPFAVRIKGPIKVVATAVLVGAFVVILADQIPVLRVHFDDMIGIAVAMNVSVLALAWLITRIASLNVRERVAIGIEHLIRQEGTAIFIAVSIIGNKTMSLPMILNTPIALVMCILFVGYARRRTTTAALSESTP